MTTFISKQEAFQIATVIVISPLSCYALEKAFPTPQSTHILALSVIDVLVRRVMMTLIDKVGQRLIQKETEVNKRNNILYWKNTCITMTLCALPIFYLRTAQNLRFPLPHPVTTLGYLYFSARISFLVISVSQALVPSLRR